MASYIASRALLKIGQNTGILLLANVAGSVIGFLMAMALGRGLGDTGFGQYSLVMTWLLSLTIVTEFGLSTVLTRDVAAKPERTRSYLANSLAGKLLLGIPTGLFLLFFGHWLVPNQNPEVIAALQWGIIFIYGGLFYSSFTAIFRAHQVMMPILWLTLLGQLVLLAGTVVLLLTQQRLYTLIAWHGASQSLQCVLAFVFYRGLAHKRGWGAQKLQESHGPEVPLVAMHFRLIGFTPIKTLIVAARPLALAGILGAFQMRASILILAYLKGGQALGWYAAANRFVETGKQLPGAFYNAVLPALAALAANTDQKENLQNTFRRARSGLLAYALLASGGAFFLGELVITLTYGSPYRPATATLQILILSLIPATQNSIMIVYLYAHHDEKFVNLIITAGITINLIFCFWLIPAWGATGTALALLLAESVIYFPYRQRVSRHK